MKQRTKQNLIHLFLWVLFTAIAINANAQTIQHVGYLTHYDVKLEEPDSVSWTIKKGSLDCKVHLARANNFIADPAIKNTDLSGFYNGSGYDRGHQHPAQDASCSTVDEVECFYMSNMVPQKPNLNRITWKALEMQCRKDAETMDVHILCGVIGSNGLMTYVKVKGKAKIKIVSTISIPKYCYKAVYEKGKWTAYIMPNQDSVKLHPYTYYTTTLANLNKQTGLKLK
jgi:DNA/RNA endonuclease G (NUC1)